MWDLTRQFGLQFLPIIGQIVADAIEETLEPSLMKKFAVDRTCTREQLGRTSAAVELDVRALCSLDDLLPVVNNT